MRPSLPIVLGQASLINPHMAQVLRAHAEVQRLLDNGELSAGFAGEEPAMSRACAAMDELQAACTAAEDYAARAKQSPFARHREAILAETTGGRWLRPLVAHLYNPAWGVDLPDLFWKSGPEHTLIAMELIESFGRRGHDDADFVALARHIVAAMIIEENQALSASEPQRRAG